MGYPSLDCENGRFVSFGFASGNIDKTYLDFLSSSRFPISLMNSDRSGSPLSEGLEQVSFH